MSDKRAGSAFGRPEGAIQGWTGIKMAADHFPIDSGLLSCRLGLRIAVCALLEGGVKSLPDLIFGLFGPTSLCSRRSTAGGCDRSRFGNTTTGQNEQHGHESK